MQYFSKGHFTAQLQPNYFQFQYATYKTSKKKVSISLFCHQKPSEKKEENIKHPKLKNGKWARKFQVRETLFSIHQPITDQWCQIWNLCNGLIHHFSFLVRKIMNYQKPITRRQNSLLPFRDLSNMDRVLMLQVGTGLTGDGWFLNLHDWWTLQLPTNLLRSKRFKFNVIRESCPFP